MANDTGGVWRTIGGRRVFIKDGQSLSDAMKESGKFKTGAGKGKGSNDGYNRRTNTSNAEYLDRGDMMDVIDKWSSEGFEEGKYKVKDGKGVFHEKYASGHLEGYGGKDDDFVIRDFDMGSAPQKEALKDLNSKLAEHGYKAEYLKDGWGASQDIKISKIKEDKISGPDSPEVKKINKPIDKENKEKAEQYKQDKGLREISKDPEAMKARLEEMKKSGEYKELLGEPDDTNKETKRKSFKEATEGLARKRKEAEEYKNAIAELREYSGMEADSAEDFRAPLNQIKERIEWWKNENRANQEASTQKSDSVTELANKIEKYNPKDHKDKWSAEDEFLARMKSGYERVKADEGKDVALDYLSNVEVVEKNDDYLAYKVQRDYGTGKKYEDYEIAQSYDKNSRFDRPPNVYVERNLEGDIEGVSVNWGAYGAQKIDNAQEFVTKLQNAVDFAKKLENKIAKSAPGSIRNSYQRYLKEHPNSEMTFQEFEQYAKMIKELNK